MEIIKPKGGKAKQALDIVKEDKCNCGNCSCGNKESTSSDVSSDQ